MRTDLIVTVNVVYPEAQKSWRVIHQYHVQHLPSDDSPSLNAARALASVYDHVHALSDHALCYRVFDPKENKEIWPGPIDDADTYPIAKIEVLPDWICEHMKSHKVSTKIFMKISDPDLLAIQAYQLYGEVLNAEDALFMLSTNSEEVDILCGYSIKKIRMLYSERNDIYILEVDAWIYDIQTFSQWAIECIEEKHPQEENVYTYSKESLLAHIVCVSNDSHPHALCGFQVIGIS